MMYAYYFMLASAGVLLVEITGSEVCEVPKLSATTRVSLNSRRNLTGHWLAQVRCFNCRITSLSCNHVLYMEAAQYSRDECYFVLDDKHPLTPTMFTNTAEERQVQLETTEDAKESASIEIDVQRGMAVCKDCSATQISMTIMGVPLQKTIPGYELIPGVGYYKFHTKFAVWWEARRICASEGAHLAIINSDEESAALRQIFARYPKLDNVAYNEVAFIGFHDLYVDGQFLTVFDEPLNSTGFTKWDNGEPDNFGGGSGENCGSIFRSGLLNDLACHLKYAFICELKL